MQTIKEALFGKDPLTPKQMKRENRRNARRAAREMDRELGDIESRETEVMRNLKMACRKGETTLAKGFARDVSQLRKSKARVNQAKSAQFSLETTLNTGVNSMVIADRMQKGLESIEDMSENMNLSQVQRLGAGYASEMDRLELMNDVVEDAVNASIGGDGEDDEDTDAALIMEEVMQGLAVDAHLPSAGGAPHAPGTGMSSGDKNPSGLRPETLDLEERLRRLAD